MVVEMERERDGSPDRELYALLHLSPEASDEDVKRAYRQWAQVYHPDKHQTPQMQDIATQNFQKIREAYEILSDERKRQIYDLYGMEGLTSGLELGPKLKSREEVRAEFERLQQRQEERKLAAHVHHRGSLLMNLSLVPFLESWDAPRMSGMAMSTQVQAQVSKRDTVVLGGNMALRRGLGGGSVTMVLRRQLSPISTVEVLAMVGLRSILSLQTSRQLSTHSTGTLGLSVSLRDGSVTLANTWSRQLSEDTTGNIQLIIGPDTGISVGWQRHGKKNAGSADVKVGPATFGVSGQYIRHFSSKSQGRLTGKIGSTGVEVEVGGERRLSEHSSAAMFCVLGLQGVSWKVRFTRGGQKFVIPIMLCTTLNPFIATGALIIPSSIYAILKTFVFKPYNLRRNRRKSLELRRTTYTQVIEARASSERSQLLLKNVAERKKQKQAQKQGLVILAAVYGDIKAYERGTNLVDKSASTEDDDADLPPPYLDVAIPVQFLVDDFGQLRLHEGVKKAGLMGFCDPCPGEGKQLKVVYSYLGHQHEVVVGDYDELRIPQDAHRIQRSATEKLDQRSSFWLQYGRLKKHLQACDALLEQINACAALPGRPKLDIPAGISREVGTKHLPARHREIPSHATPQSPFDAALNLSFQDCSDRSMLPDPLPCFPSSEECPSFACENSQPQSSVSSPKSEPQVLSLPSPSSHVQSPASEKDTCTPLNSASNGPETCNSDENVPVPCSPESKDRVRESSGCAPESRSQLRPVSVSRSCSIDMNQSNLESPLEPDEEKPPGQCIKNPVEHLTGGQSKTINLETEYKKNAGIQEENYCRVNSNATNVEGAKCALPNNSDGELEKTYTNDNSLPKHYNISSTNSQFNETSPCDEVQSFSFTNEEVQKVVSTEETHEVIDNLPSTTIQQQESIDANPISELFAKKQDSSILTYEDFTIALQMEGFSSKNFPLVEAADKYEVLKEVTTNSLPQNLERWLNEAKRVGLGWVPIDDNAIGFRVDSIQAWLVVLILIHEAQRDVKLCNTVDFKFAVDARSIENQQGTICEVMLELLCSPDPLSCVSVAKWEGDDQRWDEIFSHVAETADSKNLLRQLVAICEDGLDIEGRHLDVTFLECHHVAYYCSILCNGKISAVGEPFCPWCTVPRQARCAVTTNHNVSRNDTIAFLCSTYHMRPQLLKELNTSLEDLHREDQIQEFLPDLKSVIVFQHWPMNRHNMCKLTPGTPLNMVYCVGHALTCTILHMIRTLEEQAQQYDRISTEVQSRFTLLWRAMTNPPLLIKCEIATFQCTSYKEIKYDELNMEVANHILENHENILEVMEKIPTVEAFKYTKRMWASYRCFNRLQQMSHPHSLASHDESLAVVAREFLYCATKALGEDLTPYIHIQGAHADQFQSLLPYPIGRLKNLAMQRKHKAFQNKYLATGAKTNPYIKQDKFGLNFEMIAQFVRLKMDAMPILDDLKKQVDCWIPWLARSFYRRHFEQTGYVPISIDEAKELAEIFPTTTADQVFCLFNTWSKRAKRQCKYKPLHSSKGSCKMKNNYVGDEFNKDLSTKLQKYEFWNTSDTSMKSQRRNDSLIYERNLEMAHKEFAFDQIPNSEELLQAYNSPILSNVHIVQVDERFSINKIHDCNETQNRDEEKITKTTNRSNDWMNNHILDEIFVDGFCRSLMKETIFNNYSGRHLFQQPNIHAKSGVRIEDEEIISNGLGSNDIIEPQNYKELKTFSDKYVGDDVDDDDDDKIRKVSNIAIQSLDDKVSKEELASKCSGEKKLSCSINNSDGNEFSETLLNSNSNSKQKFRKDSNVVELQDCSSSKSLTQSQGVALDILTNESQHLVEENREENAPNDLNKTFEKIISDGTSSDTIVTNKALEGANLQIKSHDNNNALKVLPLDDISDYKKSKIDIAADRNRSSLRVVKDTISKKDIFLPKRFVSNSREQIESLRSCPLLNDKKGIHENVQSVRFTDDKVNKNNANNDENESSPSQSYSTTPEDGGILRNKRHRIDDVFQNEKSIRLKSLEKSFYSLSKKSRVYKKSYSEKTYDSYNSPKAPNLKTTSSSTTTKYSAKEHPMKVEALRNSCNSCLVSKQNSHKNKIKTLYPCNPYPPTVEECNKNKSYSRKNIKIDSKEVDQSVKFKFEKQQASQPLFEMRNERMTSSSPKEESQLRCGRVCNRTSDSRDSEPNPPQYSKKHQFIEDDSAFFHSKRMQFEPNEHEDAKNDIFMPFLFDDANFLLENYDFQISNSPRREKHKRIPSDSKKTVLITPDTCTISTNCLQCQETSEWFSKAEDISNPTMLPKIHQNGDFFKYNYGSKTKSSPRLEGEGIKSHILPNRYPYDKMKQNISNEIDENLKTRGFEDEFQNINEIKSKKTNKYGRPCCCDPCKGHGTSCYQYIPNYEPPEVTRIRNTNVVDNLKACMTCHDRWEHQSNGLEKSRNYFPSHFQSCGNVDEDNGNEGSKLDARSCNYVEKYCEYDRIGRYRRGNIVKSKSRQKWGKN